MSHVVAFQICSVQFSTEDLRHVIAFPGSDVLFCSFPRDCRHVVVGVVVVCGGGGDAVVVGVDIVFVVEGTGVGNLLFICCCLPNEVVLPFRQALLWHFLRLVHVRLVVSFLSCI